jgi:hypothetical protein
VGVSLSVVGADDGFAADRCSCWQLREQRLDTAHDRSVIPLSASQLATFGLLSRAAHGSHVPV